MTAESASGSDRATEPVTKADESVNHHNLGQYQPSAQVASSLPISEAKLSIAGTVDIDGIYTEAAKARFVESVHKFALDLADTIKDIEKKERAQGAESPEATASTVIKANEQIRDRSEAAKATPLDVILALTAPISSGAAGILGSYLDSVPQAGIFGAVAVLAVISTVMLVLRGKGFRRA